MMPLDELNSFIELSNLIVLVAFLLYVAANLWLIAIAMRTGIGSALPALFPWPIPAMRAYWAVNHWDDARKPYKACHIALGILVVALAISGRLHFEKFHYNSEDFEDAEAALNHVHNLKPLYMFTLLSLWLIWANFEVLDYHANTDVWYYTLIPGITPFWIATNRGMLSEIPIAFRLLIVAAVIAWLLLPNILIAS